MGVRKVPGISMSDRLALAAKTLKAKHELPPADVIDAIGDAPWFREYLQVCLAHPMGNAILGAIVFGWQLNDEVKKNMATSQIVHTA